MNVIGSVFIYLCKTRNERPIKEVTFNATDPFSAYLVHSILHYFIDHKSARQDAVNNHYVGNINDVEFFYNKN